MVESFDERNASQSLVLEGLDNPFRYGDGAVFAHGAEARLDVPLFQEFGKDIADEDTGLIRNDVFRRAMLSWGSLRPQPKLLAKKTRCCAFAVQSPLQSLDDPAGVGSFQRNDTHDLAGEMVDGHQDLDGPQPPAPDFRGVDRPDVIGIPGRDRAGLGLLFCCLLGGGRGYRGVSRFREFRGHHT